MYIRNDSGTGLENGGRKEHKRLSGSRKMLGHMFYAQTEEEVGASLQLLTEHV